MWIKIVGVTVILLGGVLLAVTCTNKKADRKRSGSMVTQRTQYSTGRLTARPSNTVSQELLTSGVQPLNLDSKKDGFIFVPKSYVSNKPAALAIMLHGAGGNAEQGLSLLKNYAEENTLILIAPASREVTWDIIQNNCFGPDVIFIDQALTLAFKRYNINASQVAIGGFSDGASYALCLGLTNGDLFTHILAFSPGFVHTLEQKGQPAVFISHGTQDRVLPIDPCSRRIVPQLQRRGIPVYYQEFAGAHKIPGHIAGGSVAWLMPNAAGNPCV